MKPANLFAACKELGIDPQACIAGKLKWLSDEPSDVQDEPLPLSCAVTSEQISQKEQDLIGSYRRLNESQQHDILQRVEEIIADYKVGKK